jgi:hypothetical protein
MTFLTAGRTFFRFRKARLHTLLPVSVTGGRFVAIAAVQAKTTAKFSILVFQPGNFFSEAVQQALSGLPCHSELHSSCHSNITN